MNITVFGADGRTGIEVVNCATALGYKVTAFVYNDSSNKFLSKEVRIVKGNVLNPEDVLAVVVGTDAVISVVGHIKGSDPLMQTKGMQNIVNAMEELGIKRVLSLTGTGVRLSQDKISLMDILLNLGIGTFDPARVKDGIEHAKVLQKSKLDWTILRVLKLGNSETQIINYKLTEGGPAELMTSRKKVAKVLVDLIRDEKYIRKMPIITK